MSVAMRAMATLISTRSVERLTLTMSRTGASDDTESADPQGDRRRGRGSRRNRHRRHDRTDGRFRRDGPCEPGLVVAVGYGGASAPAPAASARAEARHVSQWHRPAGLRNKPGAGWLPLDSLPSATRTVENSVTGTGGDALAGRCHADPRWRHDHSAEFSCCDGRRLWRSRGDGGFGDGRNFHLRNDRQRRPHHEWHSNCTAGAITVGGSDGTDLGGDGPAARSCSMSPRR